MKERELLRALNLDISKTPVIAVAGGGGKTSLIFRLMEECVDSGRKVIVTTTTHMAYEPERPFAEDGETDKICRDLEQYGYTVAASLDRDKGKIGSLPDSKLSELRTLCDVLLIEADGAKRLPLKVPGEREPVIPEFTDLVIGVAGMDALGQPMGEICHRPERVADFLGKEIKKPIEAEDIVKIAASPKALRKGAAGREYRVFLNKADLPGKYDMAEQIAGELEKKGISAVWGSLQKKDYNICDISRMKKENTESAKPQKFALIMLAAGNSRRFGSNKLMYEVDGVPMYLRTLRKLQTAARELGNCEIFVVTQYSEIVAKAEQMGVKALINPHPERGISSSMQIGLTHAEYSDACLFSVSDQPWLTAETITALVQKFRTENKGMACTIFDNRTGNPCIFSKKYYRELMEISGDRGGKQIIKRHPEDVTYFKIRDARELVDVDVPFSKNDLTGA